MKPFFDKVLRVESTMQHWQDMDTPWQHGLSVVYLPLSLQCFSWLPSLWFGKKRNILIFNLCKYYLKCTIWGKTLWSITVLITCIIDEARKSWQLWQQKFPFCSWKISVSCYAQVMSDMGQRWGQRRRCLFEFPPLVNILDLWWCFSKIRIVTVHLSNQSTLKT